MAALFIDAPGWYIISHNYLKAFILLEDTAWDQEHNYDNILIDYAWQRYTHAYHAAATLHIIPEYT